MPHSILTIQLQKLLKKAYTRRKFLKKVTLATATAITTSLVSPRLPVNSQNPPHVAIVGSGLAGLNAAYQLQKNGIKATVYEANNRLGGRVISITSRVGKDLVSDLGGSFINVNHQDMLSLIDDFQLKLFNRNEHAESLDYPLVKYYLDGRSLSEAELVEALTPIATQIGEDADLIYSDYEGFAPDFDKLSVTEYLDKHSDKITVTFVRTLLENIIRTEYGVEPEESSALQLLFISPRVEDDNVNLLGENDETYVIKEGTNQLIDSLAQVLTGQINLNKRLNALNKQGNKYLLTFTDNQIVEADWVILALPISNLKKIDIQVDLPAQMRRYLEEVNLGNNDKLIAGFNQRIWLQSEGFSQEIWTDLGFSAAWNETQRQTEITEGALTFFYGGQEVIPLPGMMTRVEGNNRVEQLNRIIPGIQGLANQRFVKTQWTSNPLSQGSYTSFKPGQLTEFSEFFYVEEDGEISQEVRVDQLIFAGENFSDEFYGYMNGAAQTGRLAAQIIIREIG